MGKKLLRSLLLSLKANRWILVLTLCGWFVWVGSMTLWPFAKPFQAQPIAEHFRLWITFVITFASMLVSPVAVCFTLVAWVDEFKRQTVDGKERLASNNVISFAKQHRN